MPIPIISSHYIAASLRCYVNHFFVVVVAVSYTYRVNSTYSPDTINHQYIDGVRQIPLMSWSLDAGGKESFYSAIKAVEVESTLATKT